MNLGDGTSNWSRSIDDQNLGVDTNVSSPAVESNRVFIGATNQWVYAFSTEDGSQIWRVGTGGSIRSSPTIQNGKLYIGCDDEKVYCLATENGSKHWSFTSTGPVHSTPAVDDSFVFFGSYSSPYDEPNFFALQKSDGTEKWSQSTEGRISSSPVIDGEYVYIGDTRGTLYKFDKQNGVKQWEKSDLGGISSTISISDRYIFFVGGETVYCYNKDGEQIWSYDIGYNSTSDVAASKGEVYVRTDETVTGLDLQDGTARWRIETERAVEGIPAVDNTHVYIGNTAGKLLALRGDNRDAQSEGESSTKNNGDSDTEAGGPSKSGDSNNSPSNQQTASSDEDDAEVPLVIFISSILAIIVYLLDIPMKIRKYLR